MKSGRLTSRFSYPNSGVGTRLIQDLLAEASRKHPNASSGDRFNRAIRLYERLGFIKIGESPIHVAMEWRARSDISSS